MELNTRHASTTHSDATSPHPARARCRHISRNGRPCRYLAVSPETHFCKEHLPSPDSNCSEELALALKTAARNFDTPETVKDVLFLVFCALAEEKISERRAGILCYLAQTILHSHRAIAHQKKIKASRPRVYINDLPGPQWEIDVARQMALQDEEREARNR